MKKLSLRLSVILLLLVTAAATFSCGGTQKSKNPYNLNIVNTLSDYKKSVEADKDNLLVNLETYVPRIVLDIRYADTNNFTHKKIYTEPKAYVRMPVAEALLEIQNKLNNEGLGLKIFDAYRPYAATLYFYEVYPDTNFVAAPWKGSVHNKGCAVDLTLIDIVTGKELPMPTPFDDFTEKASLKYNDLPADILANREKLIKVMTEAGFDSYEHEWWHYNFKERAKYGIMDIPFEELEKIDFKTINNK